MRQALNQAFQRLSHGFDTKLVGEREMQHAMLLGDSVARVPHYPDPRKTAQVSRTNVDWSVLLSTVVEGA